MRQLLVIAMMCSLLLCGCQNRERVAVTHDRIEVWLDAAPEVMVLLNSHMTAAERSAVNFRIIRFEDLKPAVFGSRGRPDSPDIFMFSSDWLGELMQHGLVEPLTELPGDILPVASEAMHWRGVCCGLPWSLDTIALIVNRNLVATSPQTFEQMLDLNNRLPKDVFPLLYDNKNFYYHAPFFHAFGAGIFTGPELTIAGPGAAHSFDFVHRLEAVHDLVPAKANQAAAINLFCAGQAAMTINGPWAINDFIRNRIDFAVVPIPGLSKDQPARPFVGIKGLAVSASSPRKQRALQLLRQIVSREFMDKVAAKSLFIPCFRRQKRAGGDWLSGFVRQAELGILMPSRPEMKFVWSEMNRALRLRFLLASSSAEILSDAENRIAEAIAREAGN